MTAKDTLETEIKLTASPEMLEALHEHPLLAGSDRAMVPVTTYLDTAGRRLSRAGASLRLRDNGTGHELTLKLPERTGSIVVRGEWTVRVPGPCPDIAAFGPEPREAIEQLLGAEPLVRIAETRIDRTARQVLHGAAAIELAFDRGTIRAGQCEASISELELELVSGSLADLLDLARALPLGPDLQWSVASKSGRCLALADQIEPAAAHAAPVAITRDMGAGQGFQAIAWSCLSHLLENVPLVVASGDPEALHQSRVAIRRLRAAIGLFGSLFEQDDRAKMLGAEFKAAANAMGLARDVQVLLERLSTAPSAEEQDAADLVAHLRAVATRAMTSAQDMLAGHSFQALLVDFALWIERGDWLEDAAGTRQPLPPFAARALQNRRRKIRRMGYNPAAMTVDQRHALRIAIKKWRYAADFLAALYPSKSAAKAQRRFRSAAAKVQGHLGELNDLNVLAAESDALFAGLDPIDAARLLAQLDVLMPSLSASHAKLLKRAGRGVARLDSCEPWWKADL